MHIKLLHTIIPQLVNIHVLRNSVNFTKKFVMDFYIEINLKILLLNNRKILLYAIVDNT